MDRCRAEKSEAVNELTSYKARTALDPQRSDLSGHPQFQRVRAITDGRAHALSNCCTYLEVWFSVRTYAEVSAFLDHWLGGA